MRCSAIIPARGGSKGVPRKNLARIGGETLLSRAIRKCREASLVAATFVSTEDDEIAAEAVQSGATVIWRPVALAADEAQGSDVVAHACGTVEDDILALVQCTAPFFEASEIDGTIRRLTDTRADLAIAAAPTDTLLVCELSSDRCPERVVGVNWDLASPVCRRQDREPCYEICGSVWAFWRDRFLSRGTIYSEDCVIFKAEKRFEIDEPIDLRWAYGIDLTK